MKKKPLIVVLGPTAAGKTDLSIRLAKEFSGEIVNADSQSIYKEMNIGTAKPSLSEINQVPHHLIDIVEPPEEFSVANYKKLAEKALEDIWKKNKIPFLVGGTGLYLDAIIYDYQLPKVPPNFRLRIELSGKTKEDLLTMLKKIDPEASLAIDPNNKRRIIRAIEVVKATGKPFSEMKSKKEKSDETLILGVDFYEREQLYQRINKRVDKMIAEGLIEEVKNIAHKYGWSVNTFNTIGYREISQHLRHEITLESAIDNIKKETRHLAKRQLTWFKRNQDIIWIKSPDEAKKNIIKFLNKK
jgi:tRNA dimethylallyltransferase